MQDLSWFLSRCPLRRLVFLINIFSNVTPFLFALCCVTVGVLVALLTSCTLWAMNEIHWCSSNRLLRASCQDTALALGPGGGSTVCRSNAAERQRSLLMCLLRSANLNSTSVKIRWKGKLIYSQQHVLSFLTILAWTERNSIITSSNFVRLEA